MKKQPMTDLSYEVCSVYWFIIYFKRFKHKLQLCAVILFSLQYTIVLFHKNSLILQQIIINKDRKTGKHERNAT